MTTVRELLQQTEFSQILEVLSAAGEDAEQYRQTFEDLYGLLLSVEPDTSVPQMTIRLEEPAEPWFLIDDGEEDTEDTQEESGDLQVSGYLPGDEDAYAIGLQPPAQIAAMAVDPDTLAQYDAATILAHCIAEIIYSRTTTENIWSPKMDTYAGGLYAAESCAERDMGSGLSIESLRREMGLTDQEEEKKEDYREKYGFLF